MPRPRIEERKSFESRPDKFTSGFIDMCSNAVYMALHKVFISSIAFSFLSNAYNIGIMKISLYTTM